MAVSAFATVGALIASRRRRRVRDDIRCIILDCRLEYGEWDLESLLCSLEVDLCNGEDQPTNIRDVSVIFSRDGKRLAEAPLVSSIRHSEVGALRLPPGRWIHADLYCYFEGEEIRMLDGFRRVDFAGRFPDGEVFEQMIFERKYFRA